MSNTEEAHSKIAKLLQDRKDLLSVIKRQEEVVTLMKEQVVNCINIYVHSKSTANAPILNIRYINSLIQDEIVANKENLHNLDTKINAINSLIS